MQTDTVKVLYSFLRLFAVNAVNTVRYKSSAYVNVFWDQGTHPIKIIKRRKPKMSDTKVISSSANHKKSRNKNSVSTLV
jgi:hypothetical protein